MTIKMKEAGEEEKRLAIEANDIFFDGTPCIRVIVDGGWAHRSYGHGFKSSSGVVGLDYYLELATNILFIIIKAYQILNKFECGLNGGLYNYVYIE